MVSVMKRFVVFVMNYLPDTEDTIYTLDTLPADLSGKDLCYVAVDDVCIGISDAVDLSADELTRMLLSFRREDRIPVEVGNDAPEADATEAVDAPVEESMYQEQRDYRDEVLELQERISELMVSRELSYVTESMILENPERVHVFVNTTDKEKIAYLKSLDKTGELLEIEYSTDRGVEE